MEDTNRVYRIRTNVGADAPNVIHVPLNQTYDMFEILSLKLDQTNEYKTYESDYGVVVGRVTANGGFGIENAKISVFIPVSDDDKLKDKLLYNFTSVNSKDNKGIKYNTLPDYVDDGCHQNVGTFPNKRLVLDNQDLIEMFDKYWKYTTMSNHAGDYMIFGVPTGSQTIHCDVDLSDCGILSQRPRDMMNQGYNATMFESPNKFKKSDNLNTLVQIKSQDKGVYVYPYWGDTSDGDDNFSITRCDIDIDYKFEPTAVFIGSIITDKGSNAIGKNCNATEQNGKMSDLIAGEGTIEMIRKTLDGKVEEYPIMGNRLIDGDGVWCYTIPMNLDYVTTDEFGNLVPTDNPDKGIPTRARVRFRISLDDSPTDTTARKRAKYLVPNNPRLGEGDFDTELDADYSFGSATREESFCDLFWNKVYTVKNYIPKIQKKPDMFHSTSSNRKHTGIKLVNHYGDNNPMPYNALTVKLGFTYRIICIIMRIVINLIEFINEILSTIAALFCIILGVLELPGDILGGVLGWIPVVGKKIRKAIKKTWNNIIVRPLAKIVDIIIPDCIPISSEFCDDGVNQVTYYPGCGWTLFHWIDFTKKKFLNKPLDCIWNYKDEMGTRKNHQKNMLKMCEREGLSSEDCNAASTTPVNETAMLKNCVENQLAQQNEATSFNFNNDWINGVLYAPLWYREIRPKRRYFFGLIKKKARDSWCSADRNYSSMRLLQQCATARHKDTKIGTERNPFINFDGKKIEYYRVDGKDLCDGSCQKSSQEVRGMNGLIVTETTMFDEKVYYYRAVEYDKTLPSNKCGDLLVPNTSVKEGEVKLLFATDIVLLGSLTECDMNGIPQFFKFLESTTYNMPTDILFTDYDFGIQVNEKGEAEGKVYTMSENVSTTSISAGCDWGNPNEFGKFDGGLFYSIGCSSIHLDSKSCVNLSRICEFGVSLDNTKEIPNLGQLINATEEEIDTDTNEKYYNNLVTDGFISWDELYSLDERSMFATMNGNHLKTKLNSKNGLMEYDFRYLYPENFDGSLGEIMKNRTSRYNKEVNYKNNYNLEKASKDYYLFRMGDKPYYYDCEDKDKLNHSFPRYENSFYFYFGLKAGKTAIEKFSSKFLADCNNSDETNTQVGVYQKGGDWCSLLAGENDGYLALDFSKISAPYDLLINGDSDTTYSLIVNQISEEKIVITTNMDGLPEKIKNGGYKQLMIDGTETPVPMLENGSYIGVITDSNGNITEFKFKITGEYLTFKATVQNFEEPNNAFDDLRWTPEDVAKNIEGGINTTNPNNVTRKIGGVITIYNISMNRSNVEDFTIDVRPKEKIDDFDGITIKKGDDPKADPNDSFLWKDGNSTCFAFGLPRGDVDYVVTISQLCGDVTSSNTVSNVFNVSQPIPYKMYINDVDYDLIKNFDNNTGWELTGKLNKPSGTKGQLDVSTNPWFHVDDIYYNDNLLTDVKNDRIIEFGVDLYDEKNEFNVYAILDEEVESATQSNGNLSDETKLVVTYNVTDGTNPTQLYTYMSEGGVTIDGATMFDKVEIDGTDVSIAVLDTAQGAYQLTADVHTVKYTLKDPTIIGVFEDESTGTVTVGATFAMMCPALTKVIIPNSVTSIGRAAFGLCSGLADITIPNNVTYIGDNAFILCASLTSVTIGNGITTIGNSAFSNSPIEQFTIKSIVPPVLGTYLFSEVGKIYVPGESANDYRHANGWSTYADNIKPINLIDIKVLVQEFSTSHDPNTNGQNTVYYTWIDDYIVSGYEKIKWDVNSEDEKNEAYSSVESFVNDVNSVLANRRDIVSMMKRAFYMFCLGSGSGISVTVQTQNRPFSQTIVYHPEKAVEFEDYNELDGSRLITEDIDSVSDIKIPTITYGSSPYFGNNPNSDEPCLVEINNVPKMPYSAGVMNNSGRSIPKHKNGDVSEDFKNEVRDDVKYIKKTTTDLADLFNFPIIDKILVNDYIAWSAFINIPKYGAKGVNLINMNGLLSGYIINGNIVNNKFETQELNGLQLRLSDNIAENDTYIEKRVINGFDATELGKWIISMLKNLFITYEDEIDKVVELVNKIFGSTFTEQQIEDVIYEIVVENGVLKYGNYSVSIDNVLEKILAFKNYIVDEDEKVQSTKQYSFILPISTVFDLQDETGCGIIDEIEGGSTITLANGSVNDCRGQQKILKVTAEEDTYYSIFKAGADGKRYPLYKAKNTIPLIWHIDDNIQEKYSENAPENMLSFKMKSEDLRRDTYVDTNFDSQTLRDDDESEEEVYDTTKGYGTTGEFTHVRGGVFDYPVFIVSETENHVRTLSPVYDFSDVRGKLAIAQVHTNEGNTDYGIGVRVNNGHFYLDNYPYILSGMCSNNSIYKQRFTLTEKYNVKKIAQSLYNALNADANLKDKSSITANDYVNLTHVPDFDIVKNANLYEITWDLNLPNGEPGPKTAYIEKQEDSFLGVVTDIYDNTTTYNMRKPFVSPLYANEWVGWSERDNSTIILDPQQVNSAKYYVGNWANQFTVRGKKIVQYDEPSVTLTVVSKKDNVQKQFTYNKGDAEWITNITSNSNGQVVLTLAINDTNSDRTAVIKFKQLDTDKEISFELVQLKEYGMITVNWQLNNRITGNVDIMFAQIMFNNYDTVMNTPDAIVHEITVENVSANSNTTGQLEISGYYADKDIVPYIKAITIDGFGQHEYHGFGPRPSSIETVTLSYEPNPYVYNNIITVDKTLILNITKK